MLPLHLQENTHFRTFSLLGGQNQASIMLCCSNTLERNQEKWHKIHGLYFYENIQILLDSYQDIIQLQFLFDSTHQFDMQQRKGININKIRPQLALFTGK